jgi:hypothetical protein
MAVSAADILSTAARAGWSISAERAEQIAQSATPALVSFERARARLRFEDDADGFAKALRDCALPSSPPSLE